MDYLRRTMLKVLPWPSQSPDLDMTENLQISVTSLTLRSAADLYFEVVAVLDPNGGYNTIPGNVEEKECGWQVAAR